MADGAKIRVMISSRCKDRIEFGGNLVELTDVRRALKNKLETECFLGLQLLDVWICEGPESGDGSADSWETCLEQVNNADIVLALYNGSAGWAKESGDTGICHAELMTALSTAPAKVRLIFLPLREPSTNEAERSRDDRFHSYVERQNLFRASAQTGEELIEIASKTVAAAIITLVHQGVREARKGKFHTGEPLDWSRLDYRHRQQTMVRVLRSYLAERSGSEELDDHQTIQIDNKNVLIISHAIPAAMSVATAREMVGQPFLRDHELAGLLDEERAGPIHLIACQQGITEAQAMRQLGFPDATIVAAPFGVYVADNIQKIQMVFVANCRDSTTTRHGVQRLFEWLEQTGEGVLLAKRAESRSRIVRSIAAEAEVVTNSNVPSIFVRSEVLS